MDTALWTGGVWKLTPNGPVFKCPDQGKTGSGHGRRHRRRSRALLDLILLRAIMEKSELLHIFVYAWCERIDSRDWVLFQGME